MKSELVEGSRWRIIDLLLVCRPGQTPDGLPATAAVGPATEHYVCGVVCFVCLNHSQKVACAAPINGNQAFVIGAVQFLLDNQIIQIKTFGAE